MVHVVDSEGTAGSGLQTQHWNLPAPYKAASDVTAKRVVAVDTAGQVALAATDSTAVLCVGIADQAISEGNTGQVIRAGRANDVPADGSVSQGDILKRSATTSGSVAATASPAQGEAIGVAINDSASDLVDVDVRALGITDT